MTNDALLQVTHVTKHYGTGATEVHAVRDVSLEVRPGEIALFMGSSGSGKTTLLQMMGALLKPTAGTIELNGEVLSALAENRLPAIRLHRIGFIFQSFNLLSALTVLDNVALVAELAGVKRANGLLPCSPHWSWASGSNLSQHNSQEGKSSACR